MSVLVVTLFVNLILQKSILNMNTGKLVFLCENCSKSFQSKQSFDCHKKVHNSDSSRSPKCTICEEEFKSKVTLNNHEKYLHFDIINHFCKTCDLEFKQKKHLMEHYLHVHGINQNREEYHQPK